MKLTGRKVFNFFNIAFMLFLILITAYPFYYVVIASFSDPVKLSAHSGILLAPLKPYEFGAYEAVFSHPLLISGFLNTLFLAVVGTFMNLFFTALGAFFLSQKGPMFKNVIVTMVIITMYFYGGLVPNYLLIKNLGLLNSRMALILPGLINAVHMIILKTAFQSIPESLTESALLDGGSYFQILLKIMIPLSKATLAVLVLYHVIGYWNEWFQASIYLRDKNKYPLQLAVKNLLEEDAALKGDAVMTRYAQLMKYAIIVVVSSPIVILYPYLTKYFEKGVMMGSVKS